MAELEVQSPPRRRKRFRPSATLSTAAPQATSPALDIATAFHGLAPVSSGVQEAVGGAHQVVGSSREGARATAAAGDGAAGEECCAEQPVGEGGGDVEQELSLKVASRPPSRPSTPLRKHLVHDSSNRDHQLPCPRSPSPTAAAWTSPQQQQGSSDASVSRPAPHKTLDAVDSTSERQRADKKDRTGSAQWAARVLSPIARKEQTESRNSRRTLRSSKLRVEDSSEEEEEEEEGDSTEEDGDRLPLSVDDFLAAMPRALRSAKKQYSSKGKRGSVGSRSDGRSSAKAGKSSSSASKKRKRGVARDYTSSADDNEDGYGSLADLPTFPRRSRRSLPASRPRDLHPLPRFAGASGTVGGRVKPPFEYRHLPRPLELERPSQMDEEEECGPVVGRREQVRRVEAGKSNTAFLSSIGRTAFYHKTCDKGKARAEEPEGEGAGEQARAEGGQQRITSRIFDAAAVALLEPAEYGRHQKRRRLGKGQSAAFKFPALEMEQVGAEDFAPAENDGEDPFFAAQRAAMPNLSFATQPGNSARARPATPLHRKKAPARLDMGLASIAERRAVATFPRPISRSTASSAPKRVSWSSTGVQQMNQAFDRRLKRSPVVLVPNTISTAMASRPAPTVAEADELAEEAHKEDEVDPIALLPTPIPPSFRFVTGPRPRPPRKLQLVDEDEAGNYHPPEDDAEHEEQEEGPLQFVTAQQHEAEEELERAINEENPELWQEVAVWSGSAEASGGEGRGACPSGVSRSYRGSTIEVSHSLGSSSSPYAAAGLASTSSDEPHPSPSRKPRRQVTFSSPLAPSLAPRLHSTTSRAAPKAKRQASRAGRARTPSLRRAKTIDVAPRTPRKLSNQQILQPHSSSTISSRKPLRRLSIRPEFQLPGERRASPQGQQLNDAGNSDADTPDVHSSSHEYTPPSPVDPPSLVLPPAAQPQSDALVGAEALESSVDYYGDEGSTWDHEMLQLPSFNYLDGDRAEEGPPMGQLVEEAEEDVDEDEDEMAPTSLESEGYSGDHLWDAYDGNSTNLIIGPHLGHSSPAAQLSPAPPRPSPPRARGLSDPTALFSLPSSFNARVKHASPRRARTVWKGQRLSGLGQGDLGALMLLKGLGGAMV